MARLIIDRFSCIKQADIELNRLTILIGEQASGKSVIAKLFYFFNNLIFRDILNDDEITDISAFNEHISADFKQLFPASAWGREKFSITFIVGLLHITIKKKSGKDNSALTIELSKSLEDLFLEYRQIVISAKEKIKLKDDQDGFMQLFEVDYKIKREFLPRILKLSNEEFSGWQLYIPAGRSFFTSLGKAISAFGKSGMLDPITTQFGEFYVSAKQRISGRTFFYPRPRVDHELKSVMTKFFGGNIIFKKEEEFVETSDGRLIPVAYLSSGQQELLPLWSAVEEAVNVNREKYIIYIEEPEAHIFPSTQSQLIEYISTFLVKKQTGCKVFITTHSPYVLAKFNNLIKAGAIGNKRGKSAKVAAIISKDSWLKPNSLNAYQIKDGILVSIIDEDGLIDAEFLDSVSGLISEEYMELVKIECEDA